MSGGGLYAAVPKDRNRKKHGAGMAVPAPERK